MTVMHLTDPLWHQIAPLLDEALDRLPEADRDALVLRFFEKHDFRGSARCWASVTTRRKNGWPAPWKNCGRG